MDVREKLVELLNGVQHYGTICTMSQMDDRCASIKQVQNTDVAERLIAHGVTVQERGHWEDDHCDYVCSCCHTVFTDDIVWLVRGESNEPNYCPHCGAKMMPQPPKGE